MHCVTGFGGISRGIGRALDFVGNVSFRCTIPVYNQDAWEMPFLRMIIKGSLSTRSLFHGRNSIEEGQVSTRTIPCPGPVLQYGKGSPGSSEPTIPINVDHRPLGSIRRLSRDLSLGSGRWPSEHDFFLGDTTPETIGHPELQKESAAIRDSSGLDLAAA